MTEGDTGTIDVCFAHVSAELLAAIYSLSCESFVQFNQFEVFHFEAGLLEQFMAGRDRTSTHDSRFNTCGSPVKDFSNRFDTEFFGFFLAHENQCAGSIVDTGSVTSCNCAVFCESRF